MAAVSATTTTSASAATAHRGRSSNHPGFGLCGSRPWRPSARPPRLRPVLRLLITAACPTTTTSACAATAHGGRRCNRHGFGLVSDCPRRPSTQPPRLRPLERLLNTAVGATATALGGWVKADADCNPTRPLTPTRIQLPEGPGTPCFRPDRPVTKAEQMFAELLQPNRGSPSPIG